MSTAHCFNSKAAAFSLSFDDARPSQIESGVPALDQYGIKGTFYVYDGENRRIENNLDDWRAAAAAGHEIGNHSLRHPCSGNFRWIGPERALENYTLDAIEDELIAANDLIFNLLGIKPVSYAYPCGLDFVGSGEQRRSYVPVVAKHFLTGRGYRNEYMNDPAVADLAFLGAFGVDQISIDEMIRLIERAIAEQAWIIFAAHEMPASDADKGMTTGNIARLCEWIQANADRLWCAPVGEVAERIQSARTEHNAPVLNT